MNNFDDQGPAERAFLLNISRYQKINLKQLGEILNVNPVPANNKTVKITTRNGSGKNCIEIDIARFTVTADGTVDMQNIELLNGTSLSKSIHHVARIGRLPDSAPNEIIVYVIPEPFNGEGSTVEEFCKTWDLSLPDPLITS